jgi:hypothetical protein
LIVLVVVAVLGFFGGLTANFGIIFVRVIVGLVSAVIIGAKVEAKVPSRPVLIKRVQDLLV